MAGFKIPYSILPPPSKLKGSNYSLSGKIFTILKHFGGKLFIKFKKYAGMKFLFRYPLFVSVCTIFFIFASCEEIADHNRTDISDSLEPIEEVTEIAGAEEVTLIVEKSDASYFNLEFQNIKTNAVIANGIGEGWCIDWQTLINSEGGRYENVKLYSTFRVEKWKPLNYLLNIKDDLLQSDPEISWHEIQLLIWSLRGYPEFNLDDVALEDLPSRMTTNGEPNFSYERVNEILEQVKNNYHKFDYREGSKFAVIAETPADVQTVITVVE